MVRCVPLLALALLSACSNEPSPEEQARADAAAVAMVERANDVPPPLEQIDPQILTQRDVAEHTIEGARCTYMPGTNGSPRLITRSLDAFLKLDGEVIRLAADSGSMELAQGTRRQYNGRQFTVLLDIEGGEGEITIRDPYEREIFAASGPVICVDGARAPDNPAPVVEPS